MNGFTAFFGKEMKEFSRSGRIWIMAAVFLLLGVMNPFTAMIMPELLENMMPEGMNISIGDPTAMDSWLQFYKNVPQMGLIVTALLFSSSMSHEYSKDTLVNMVTKGLSRPAVVLSKYVLSVMMWTLGFLLCFGVSWGYTAWYWDGDGIGNIIFAAFCLWVYGDFLLSVVLFGSTACNSSYGGLLLTGIAVAAQFVIKFIPDSENWNLLILAEKNTELLSGGAAPSDLVAPLVLAVFVSIAVCLASVAIFNKKAL